MQRRLGVHEHEQERGRRKDPGLDRPASVVWNDERATAARPEKGGRAGQRPEEMAEDRWRVESTESRSLKPPIGLTRDISYVNDLKAETALNSKKACEGNAHESEYDFRGRQFVRRILASHHGEDG